MLALESLALLSFYAFSLLATAQQSRCETSLLGVGVLGRSPSGVAVLGIGSYVSVHHEDLAEKMHQAHGVAWFEWLGEMRYTRQHENVLINEVNETSGYFARGASGVLMVNDARAIPQRWRGPQFRRLGHDPGRPHLSQTLNKLPGNLRHDIANVLQKFVSLANILKLHRHHRVDQAEALSRYLADPQHPSMVLEWLIEELVEGQILERERVSATSTALGLLYNLDLLIDLMNSMPVERIDDEIGLLSQVVQGAPPFNAMQFFSDEP